MHKSFARATAWGQTCGLAVNGAIAALLLLLGTGIALGFSHTAVDVQSLAREVSSPGAAARWTAAGALVAATLACAWWFARRAQPVAPPLFLGGLIVATLLLRATLIATVDPAWSTDYLRYWQQAVEMVANGGFAAENIYQQRALLVPYPVELLLGPDATTALKWTNALLLLMLQLAVYDMMRLSANHQAAQAASLVLLASPLPAYAALIPSHDLWALAFLAGGAWTAVRTWRLPLRPRARLACVVGLGVLCGCFAYALELQRSIGLLFCVALLLASALHLLSNRTCKARPLGSQGVSLLLVVALALALQPVIDAASKAAGLHAPVTERSRAAAAMKYSAHGSSMGTGRSAWYARFNDRFRAKSMQDADIAEDFARSVVLSTWSLQPMGKLDAMAEHAGRLFSLSYPPDWDTLLRQPDGMDQAAREALVIHIGLFGLALLATMLASLLVLCASPNRVRFPVLMGVIFVTALALVLLVLFENKPFNLAPAWLLYPMVFGCALARIESNEFFPSGTKTPKPIAVVWTCSGVAMLIAGCLGAWLLVRGTYGPSDGLVLDHWQVRLDQRGEPATDWERTLEKIPPRAFDPRYYVHDRRGFVLRDAPEDGHRIQKRADNLYLTLQFPLGSISKGDAIVATRDVCLDGASRSLEFFMFAPYARRGVEEAFSVEVGVDGSIVSSSPIPHRDRSDTMQYVLIPGALDGSERCHDVSITLVSNVNRGADSWARASYVEIWFPRAVADPAPALHPNAE